VLGSLCKGSDITKRYGEIFLAISQSLTSSRDIDLKTKVTDPSPIKVQHPAQSSPCFVESHTNCLIDVPFFCVCLLVLQRLFFSLAWRQIVKPDAKKWEMERQKHRQSVEQ
jgi:hypothetical protein